MPKLEPAIIAIDGPAASGKSTLASHLAQRLGFLYLDTGAMYRAVALKVRRLGLDPREGEEIAKVARESRIEFRREGGSQRVLLDGEDVTEALRAPGIGSLASQISVHSPVRRVLVEQQRRIAEGAVGVIAEGRDTTTVVFPQAHLKIFLTASLEVRACRRYEELKARGIRAEFAQVLEEMRERDRRDSTRADSPLQQAPDAVVVNTDSMSIEQMVEQVLALWRQR